MMNVKDKTYCIRLIRYQVYKPNRKLNWIFQTAAPPQSTRNRYSLQLAGYVNLATTRASMHFVFTVVPYLESMGCEEARPTTKLDRPCVLILGLAY